MATPLEALLVVLVNGRLHMNRAKVKYNSAHASLCSIVDHSIGLLKSRFHCIQRNRTPHYSPRRSSSNVAACAVLHNLCFEGDIGFDSLSNDSRDENSEHDRSLDDDLQPRFRHSQHTELPCVGKLAATMLSACLARQGSNTSSIKEEFCLACISKRSVKIFVLHYKSLTIHGSSTST
ncbi:hypothetical protein MRX96_011343 [Rhipicephalus microplus]